jgi:hypothetical protein
MSVYEILEVESFWFIKDLWNKKVIDKRFLSRGDCERYGRSLIRSKYNCMAIVRSNIMIPLSGLAQQAV